MAFGGLDMEALRAELTAARQERVALLQQAADLEVLQLGESGAVGPADGTYPFDGFQGFPTTAPSVAAAWSLPTPSAVELPTRMTRKLSWGKPRTLPPTADSSVFSPLAAPGVNGGGVNQPTAGPTNGILQAPNTTGMPGLAVRSAYSSNDRSADGTSSEAEGPAGRSPAAAQGGESPALAGSGEPGSGPRSNPSTSSVPVSPGAITAGAPRPFVTATSSPTATFASASAGSGTAAAAAPAIKLGSGGFGSVAAAAARAAAAAAVVATTGQPVAPWMAHHAGSVASAGLDLAALKRMVLKEVLAAVLGESPNSAKLEHMRLDVETVAAVVRQRTTDAAAAAATEAEERVRSAAAEKHSRAVKAAEERGEKALAELRKTLEEDKRRVQAKLDRFRGQVADLEKEKKSLSGRAGQQARELREAKEALALSKQIMGSAQNTADAKGKAMAKAMAEVERLRAEAVEMAEAHATALEATAMEAEAQRVEVEARAEAKVTEARQEAEARVRALEEAHSAVLAEALEGVALERVCRNELAVAVEGAVEEVASAVGEMAEAVGPELVAVGEDLLALQSDLAVMRVSFREELRAMREAAYAAIGGFHAACRTAAAAHAERAAQLCGLDERLQRLGPGGLAALVEEADARRAAEAEARSAEVAARRQAEEGAVSRQEAEVAAAAAQEQLQALSSAHKDLGQQLESCRTELSTALAESERMRDTVERLKAQLRKAKDESTEQQTVLQGSRRELEAVRNALRRCESELAAAAMATRRGGSGGEPWRGPGGGGGGGGGDLTSRSGAAAAAVAAATEEATAAAAALAAAAARQDAVATAVGLLSELRERYFQPVPPLTSSCFRSSHSSTSTTSATLAAPDGASPAGAYRDVSPACHRPSAPLSDASDCSGAGPSPPYDNGAMASQPGGGGGSGSVVSELEAALGVRLRDPDPDRVSTALEALLSRYHLLLTGAPAGPGLAHMEQEWSPARTRGVGVSPQRQCRQLDSSQPPQSSGLPAAAVAAGGWLRPVVLELACFEGCLLVALLDRRMGSDRGSCGGGGRSSSVGGRSGSSGGGDGGSSSCAGSSGSSRFCSREVRGQVAHMVRAMINERKQLMQRIREMHAAAGSHPPPLPPPPPPPPLPPPSPQAVMATPYGYAYACSYAAAAAPQPPPVAFSVYTPFNSNSRRLLSSSAAAGAAAGASQPPLQPSPTGNRSGGSSDRSAGMGVYRPAAGTLISAHGGSWTSPGEAPEAPRFSAVPYSTVYHGGTGEAEVTGTPRAAGARRGAEPPRCPVRRSTDTEVMMGTPSPPSAATTGLPLAGSLYGADSAAAVAVAECTLPPLPNPYSYGTGQAPGICGGSPLQAPDMEELMDVLQALDDSALRRSRGAPMLAESQRQSAWAAWDGPGSGPAAATIAADVVGNGVMSSRRGGAVGSGVVGTPPKGPNIVSGGGGGGGAMSVSPGGVAYGGGGGSSGYDTTVTPPPVGRSMGRTVSWSGPGAGGGGGSRVSRVSSAEGTDSSGVKRGSPYLGPASGPGRAAR